MPAVYSLLQSTSQQLSASALAVAYLVGLLQLLQATLGRDVLLLLTHSFSQQDSEQQAQAQCLRPTDALTGSWLNPKRPPRFPPCTSLHTVKLSSWAPHGGVRLQKYLG